MSADCTGIAVPRACAASATSLLDEHLAAHRDRCTECGACVKPCAFLQQYGTPKALATAYNPEDAAQLAMPFACSLCGLCTAVCPEGLDPGEMFLELRREAVRRGAGKFAEHRGLMGYEARGTSPLYSYYALPAGCDTVFFPGCTFSGTRAQRVRQVFAALQEQIPHLGIVLDCCSKPSHDLGRQELFADRFGELRRSLVDHGVRTVLVACPNCFKVFQRYGEGLAVRTVQEVLADAPLPHEGVLEGLVTVHDPCVVRFEPGVQAAARRLLERTGLRVEEMRNAGRQTLCCGEGGAAGTVSPELAETWKPRRAEQARGRRVATYCAGCANQLARHTPTSHVLDLVFEPHTTLAGKVRVRKAPFTYLDRLGLKRHFQRTLDAAASWERPAPTQAARRGRWLKPVLLLAFLAAAILTVRATGATRYLEQETLRGLIQGYGLLAPLAYMFLYTIAPPLFLPGLPITVVGGVLFGPFWGVVYTTIGANLGANLAFFVSRYLAREWVETKLASPRWRILDQRVAEEGWKVVAVTRLVPLFPFNLLNYAFGLTRVPWSHYALATLVCMFPACVAFIVFSSSLLDLVRGRVSPAFLAGLALVAAVSAIPLVYRRFHGARARKSTLAGPTARVYSLGRSLRTKALLLAGLGVTVGLGIWLIRRYFYVLDAYVYTWEFHYLFWVNNLRAGDLAKFTEYLAPMAPAGPGGAVLALAQTVQAAYLPLTPPLLPEAALQAYGAGAGGLSGWFAVFGAALVLSAAGWFLLGDLLPLAGRRTATVPAR
ncbi:MAG: VTT domain-containing protein, partial [Thermodesulfobacteriota bacterium]